MSDLALAVQYPAQPIDIVTSLSKWAQLNQLQAQTQGQNLQNQGLAQQNAFTGQVNQAKLALFNGGMQGAQSGGQPPMLGDPAMRGQAGGLGAYAGGTPAMGGNVPGLAGSIPVSSAPLSGPQPNGAPRTQANDTPGVLQGLPSYQDVSRLGYLDSNAAKEQSSNLQNAYAQRLTQLQQTASQPSNGAEWNQMLDTELKQGWMSQQQHDQLYNRFDLQPHIVASFADANAKLAAQSKMTELGLTQNPDGSLSPNPVVGQAAAQKAGDVAGAELPAKVALQRAAPQKLGEKEQLFYPAPGGSGTEQPQSSPSPSTGSSGSQPAGGSLSSRALNSIPDPNVRGMAASAAMQAGLPPEAVPAWISAVHNESKWNLKAPDGTSGEIGPGQVMPGTGAMMGYTPSQLRDPETNLLASAQYFKQKWQQAQGVSQDPSVIPAAAIRGYNTGTSAPGSTAYTQEAMGRINGWQGGSPQAAPTRASFTGIAPSDSLAPTVTNNPDGSTVVTSGITPNATATATANATAMADYRKGLLADSGQAVQSNAVLEQAGNEIQSWQSGPFAHAKMTANKYLDAVGQTFSSYITGGYKPDASVGDWEAFNKNALQLAMNAAHGLTSRVGIQELSMIHNNLPTDYTTPQGFQQVKTELMGLNDYRIAKSAASSSATGVPNQFDADWNKNVTPTAFIVNRMPTADFQALAQRLGQTSEGRATLNSIESQMRYASEHHLFDYVK